MLVIDDDPDFTNCNYNTQTGCLSNSASTPTSPVTTEYTISEGSDLTWYSQICDDDNLCDSTVDLDYTILTDKNAFEKAGMSATPSDYDSEAVAADYSNITSENQYGWISALVSTDGEYNSQVYIFNLTQSTPKVVNLTWVGFGDKQSGYVTNFSFYNWSSGDWIEAKSKDFLGYNLTNLTGGFGTGADDFVNSTTNQLGVLVSGKNYEP